MKLKHRPLLSPSIAQLAWHVARTTGAARAPHRDDCVERFVSPRHEVIAAPLPKVASRTMMGMFEAMPYKTEVLDASPAELRQRYPGFFIFSVVRNPWARVLSFWKDKVADACTLGKVSILARYEGLRPGMPFPELVEWLETPEAADDVADRHFLSQSAHLTIDGGTPLCDYVGRIETLAQDMQEVERRTGVAFPRVAPQNTKPTGGSFRSFYTPAMRDIVARRYAADIDSFGYSF